MNDLINRIKVYICRDNGRWGEDQVLLGVYVHKKDAIDMCIASNIDPKHSIEETDLIE
jgi:hypothetical protein